MQGSVLKVDAWDISHFLTWHFVVAYYIVFSLAALEPCSVGTDSLSFLRKFFLHLWQLGSNAARQSAPFWRQIFSGRFDQVSKLTSFVRFGIGSFFLRCKASWIFWPWNTDTRTEKFCQCGTISAISRAMGKWNWTISLFLPTRKGPDLSSVTLESDCYEGIRYQGFIRDSSFGVIQIRIARGTRFLCSLACCLKKLQLQAAA